MAIKRPKPQELVVKLRQVEVLMGQGDFAASLDDKTLYISLHKTWPGVPGPACPGPWTGNQGPVCYRL